MPFLTQPKGTPAPDVAGFGVGAPLEAFGGPVTGLLQSVEPEAQELGGIASTGFQKAVRGLQDAYRGVSNEFANTFKPASPYSGVTRQPKAGGVLHDVLSRAAEAQGAGQDVTPGSKRLLDHFAGLIR